MTFFIKHLSFQDKTSNGITVRFYHNVLRQEKGFLGLIAAPAPAAAISSTAVTASSVPPPAARVAAVIAVSIPVGAALASGIVAPSDVAFSVRQTQKEKQGNDRNDDPRHFHASPSLIKNLLDVDRLPFYYIT
jgi:hypothetical protein